MTLRTVSAWPTRGRVKLKGTTRTRWWLWLRLRL